MNEYSISDYSIFTNATSTTKELITNIENSNTSLQECKNIIENTDIFMGPIADECKETTNSVNLKFNDDISTFNIMIGYFNEISEKYQNGDLSASNTIAETTNSEFASISGSGTMTSGNFNGNTYNVANTKGELQSYIDYIKKNQVAETKDFDTYGGHCLGFSYVHAYGIYTNRRNYTADNGLHSSSGGSFTKYINDDKQAVLSKVYTELNQNKPVVLQVNGNSKGTSRHFVTVVGYKSSVTNAAELKETDLLIIDSYDGKLKSMDQAGSRFMTSGAQCGKDYSGYRADCIKS